MDPSVVEINKKHRGNVGAKLAGKNVEAGRSVRDHSGVEPMDDEKSKPVKGDIFGDPDIDADVKDERRSSKSSCCGVVADDIG